MIIRILRLCFRSVGNIIPPSHLRTWFFRKSGLKIGKNVHISHGVYIADGYRGNLVELKDECVLSPYVVLVPSSHPNTSFIANVWSVSKRAKITIGHGAWIGAGAVILPGVQIGEGVIVGANAVVRENIPDYAIFAGIPAICIGDVRNKPIKSQDAYLQWQKSQTTSQSSS